nr:DNA topoisomerase 2 [Moumouvirus Monve]
MHLFNEHGKIKKYNSYTEILNNFIQIRLDLYQKRKDHLLGKWKKEMDMLKWKVKFIEYVIDGTIIIFKNGKSKKKEEIMNKLEELKFPKFITGVEKNPSYTYITSTGLFNLTLEEVEKLKKQLADKKEEIATLEAKTPKDIWIEELDLFIEAYDKWEAETDADYEALLNNRVKPKSRKAKNSTSVEK